MSQPKRIAVPVSEIPFTEKEVAGPYDSATQTGNYDESRSPIDRIIIHTTDGTAEGAAARFLDVKSNVSAHYLIRLDGSLWHFLEEYFTAYQAGDYAMNQRSIGIEHEDGGNYNSPRPDAIYTTSAKLVANIAHFYSIPIDRIHIKKHNEVSDLPTGCPDSLDIERIVREALLLSPHSDLQTCQTVRDTNWNIVLAVAQQLQEQINPDDKPTAQKLLIQAIKNLQSNQKPTIDSLPNLLTSPPATVTENDKTNIINFLKKIGVLK